MSNFFQSTNINAGKYYQNGIEIDLGAQGAQGAQGIHGAAANQGAQGSTGAQGAQGATPQFGLVPNGSIIMWSAAQTSEGKLPYWLPVDWYLCNGDTHNGVKTPNLIDKFIIGVGAGSTFNINDSSGSNLITVNNLPSHTHQISPTYFSADTTSSFKIDTQLQVYGVDENGSVTQATGGDVPYYPNCYALCYIMYIP